jgi:hypothetical protein
MRIHQWVMTMAVLTVGGARAAEPDVPKRVLQGGGLKLTVYLPDAKAGFYRGTRFDWSGIVATAEVDGHTVFGYWKATHDPANFEDAPGTAEELGNEAPLGYAEAKVGGTFVKIGVGELEKPAEPRYRFSTNYKIVKPGTWQVTPGDRAIDFRQELSHPPTGYAYRYHKRVAIAGDRTFVIERTLTNTGTRRLDTDHYGHNFLTVDNDPVGPNYTLRFGFPATAVTPAGLRDIAAVRDGAWVFLKPLESGHVQSRVVGWQDVAEQHRVTVEHRPSGLAMRIQGDRPLTKFNVWSVRTTLCPEPYVQLSVEPGQSVSWATRYTFGQLGK